MDFCVVSSSSKTMPKLDYDVLKIIGEENFDRFTDLGQLSMQQKNLHYANLQHREEEKLWFHET